ncbi:MAG: hypothetical protein FJ404_11970 [Verrucomicrobia bacterium]|nr:hypothetical protein [Verrucomicrobiota bacterium]
MAARFVCRSRSRSRRPPPRLCGAPARSRLSLWVRPPRPSRAPCGCRPSPRAPSGWCFHPRACR